MIFKSISHDPCRAYTYVSLADGYKLHVWNPGNDAHWIDSINTDAIPCGSLFIMCMVAGNHALSASNFGVN